MATATITAALLGSGVARADEPPVFVTPPSPAVAPAPAVPPGAPAAEPAAPLPPVTTAHLPEPELPPEAPRPRFSLALGMGVSFDQSGLTPQRTARIPSFFAVGGFGDGFIGLDFAVFANNASGRYRAPDVPVDRLAADALVAWRPACHGIDPEATAWGWRLLRTIALELGVGYERDGRGAGVDHRFGPRVGGRVELPLTRAGDPSQLRLRLGGRRFFGGTKVSGAADLPLKDSTLELYGALAVIF